MSDTKLKFRFAEAGDAEKFSLWAAENPQIDRQDILAATKEKNPTTTFLVIEDEAGEPVMFMPVYLVMRIGYLAFNPANSRGKNLAAMEEMLKALQAFAGVYSIGQIDTLTRAGIPVAEWAKEHGFTADDRELFTLKNEKAPLENTVH